LVDDLKIKAMSNFVECKKEISDRGLPFGIGAKNGFKEIVQRHTARYEMPYRMDELASLVKDNIGEGSSLFALVSDILGTDCKIINKSLVVSMPGSMAQSWHQDGPHMSSEEHLSCHCLNVFLPLVTMTPSLGPTEFRPNSHYLTRDLKKMFLAAAVGKRLKSPEAPILSKGSAVLFDYRVLHRGLANISDEVRPILVLTYAKPWFQDVLNFPLYSIFDERKKNEGEKKKE